MDGLMLCLEDCIALSSLTEEEVAAIAEHEHLPMMVAAELGNYLVQTPDGSRCIKEMIRDDIRVAHESDNLVHELTLKLVLHHYLSCHPETTGTARCSSSGGQEIIRRVLERMPPRYA
jgi:hypothetical protein